VNITIRKSDNRDLTLTVPDGTTVMEVLTSAGFSLDAPCAGQGRCGKCLVTVYGDFEPPAKGELEILADRPDQRLACQARGRGEVTVILEDRASFSALKGLGQTAPYNFDPAVTLVQIPDRDRRDQKPLVRTLGLYPKNGEALSQLAVLEANRTTAKALCYHQQLLGAWPDGQGPDENLALAVDLGTTGLAVAVIDLDKKETVAVETSLNPQTTVGGDVISRITYAAESSDNLKRIQELVIRGIAELVTKAVPPERIKNLGAAIICGNTTMLHLLAGINPKSLAQAPYRPIFVDPLRLSELAPRLGLPPWAMVVTTPSISAYVGGDITAGLIATQLVQRPGTLMFIDIGTNGEIVLSRNGRLVATSCAAGPALEGMNISCGMRAITGAIDSFYLGPDMAQIFTAIGRSDPKGICGSGLIDIVAELIRAGVITSAGRLIAPKSSPDILRDGKYHLTDSIYLSQKDVRQVQLAKGAIAAAMRMLLDKMELSLADLDEVVIAGSFGYHLQAENLLTISLIPKGYNGPITFVGNSALAGAARLLLDRSATTEIEWISQNVEVVELSFDPKFQNTFLEELSF
jgi:uncharacterized 2Fe-2S/4Fe-4S cluster protein (DUF4445 family)